MKGLLRNNFYTVAPSLKTSLTLFFIFFTLSVIFSFTSTINSIMINSFSYAVMGSFSGLSVTLVYNDNLSKWNKFELTAPVTKNDVIKSKYICFALFAFIAIFLMSTMLLTHSIINGDFNTERLGYSITFAFVFMIVIPSIMYPLILHFGMDKTQVLFMISIIISLALFILPTILLKDVLNQLPNADLIYRISTIIVSILIFTFSYFLSKKLYNQNDL